MNRTQIISGTLMLLLSFPVAQEASGQCETTLTYGNLNAQPPEPDADWFNDEHWSAGKPSPTKVACVPSGFFVQAAPHLQVPPEWAEAEALVIEAGGTVDMEGDENQLGIRIYSNSTINGELCSYGTPIVIMSNMTISGTGFILGADEYLVLKGDTSSRVLTLASGFSFVGRGIIEINLVNNGTVSAEAGTLRLTTNAKSGSGVWQAKYGYELRVEVAVTGAGHWKLVDHASSKITIDSACWSLEGPVTITKGTLDANQNFRTCGNLSLYSIYALVDVAAERTVKFGVPIAGLCGGGG